MNRMLTAERERSGRLQLRLDDALNRLFAASDAGKIIPPSAIDETVVDPRDETPLAPVLREFIDGYEDAETRAKYERIIRRQIGKLSPLEILKQFEPGQLTA